MELKYELLAFSKKLIGNTTPSSRAIGAKCRMARLSVTLVATRRWRESCSMQKYGVSNSSWIRMICAPCFAASRTSRSAVAMFRVDVPAAGELHGRNRDFALSSIQMRGLTHANTLPGLRMPLGSSARLSRRIVEISAGVRDSGR